MAERWLAELDRQLHECRLPRLRWGRIHTCTCGCIWEAVLVGRAGSAATMLRWALTRDPDRAEA